MSYFEKHYFGNNREIVIQRDGEKCIRCQMTRAQHKRTFGRDITVDHIDGQGRNTPFLEKNNEIDNLQTLCLHCHGLKDIKMRRGSYSGRSPKISFKHLKDIHNLLSSGTKPKDIALMFNVTVATIYNIKHKKLKYTQ